MLCLVSVQDPRPAFTRSHFQSLLLCTDSRACLCRSGVHEWPASWCERPRGPYHQKLGCPDQVHKHQVGRHAIRVPQVHRWRKWQEAQHPPNRFRAFTRIRHPPYRGGRQALPCWWEVAPRACQGEAIVAVSSIFSFPPSIPPLCAWVCSFWTTAFAQQSERSARLYS